FGQDTIQWFAHNVSEMKSLAACNFEDILQCCISCLEGLISKPHNALVMDLLYLTAYWHSLAKLHLHTKSSVCVMEEVHKGLSNGLCNFVDITCKAFHMVKTDKEYAEQK
ncbi:hypothetical protein F5146DRAFT_938714, partial [Armillaria mellea]